MLKLGRGKTLIVPTFRKTRLKVTSFERSFFITPASQMYIHLLFLYDYVKVFIKIEGIIWWRFNTVYQQGSYVRRNTMINIVNTFLTQFYLVEYFFPMVLSANLPWKIFSTFKHNLNKKCDWTTSIIHRLYRQSKQKLGETWNQLLGLIFSHFQCHLIW